MRGYPRGPAPPHICPETGEEISYYRCASECSKYGVHAEGDLPMCVYEYRELLEQGFYAKTQEEWLDHLRHNDPETWRRLVEEEKERELGRGMTDGEIAGTDGGTEFEEEEPEAEPPEEENGRGSGEDEEKHDVDEDDDTDDDFGWDDDEEDEEDEWW